MKNERVAMSNKKPIKKVFPSLKKPLSTSEKFQIKKLNLTINENIKNSSTKAFKVEKRFGKIL